jgi:hypothetical protein
MFGMLDYRAYKLYWLIWLPFRFVLFLSRYVILAVAIGIAYWTGFHPLIQIVVAYVAMEGITLVFAIVWMLLIAWPIEKVFFWVIDVVPSKGADMEEAQAIARNGPIVWLSTKLMNDIENWTHEDSYEFIKRLNWRARFFFDERKNFAKRVQVLWRVHDDTGKQPAELPQAELNKLLKPYQLNSFQSLIVNPYGWNAIVGLVIIICAILYLNAGRDVWVFPNLA